MPTTLLLFRHALATHSLTGYGDQILTADILPEGIPPIERLAHFLVDLPSDAQYVSPVKRCQQTVGIVSKIIDKSFVTDARLSEFQGEYPNESIPDLHQRCQSFLDERTAENDKKTIMICTHGAVIGVIKNLFLFQKIAEENVWDFPATGELWLLRDGQVEALNFN